MSLPTEPAQIPDTDSGQTEVESLRHLIMRLRSKDGCPWDRQQTPDSMLNYLLEEIYELVDAVKGGETSHVCEELGDVLFQVLFIAGLFEEMERFSLGDVVAGITRKMIRRHPHVFGDRKVRDTAEIRDNWHQIKRSEKSEGQKSRKDSLLDSVPVQLPALMRAYRLSERAARVGFDWPDVDGVMAKVEEEWQEFKEALVVDSTASKKERRAPMEFGDILFTLVNAARWARIHPETALAGSVKKFENRFRGLEQRVADSGRAMETVSPEELNRMWDAIKEAED